MEEYEEEIKVKKEMFFLGTATFKYNAERNFYLSERDRNDHFNHGLYYQIRIRILRQITHAEFASMAKKFSLVQTKGDIIAAYKSSQFSIAPDQLSVTKEFRLDHHQTEGDTVHGYAVDVPVLVRMHKLVSKTQCIEGHPTGREEQREDGLYKEYYYADCSTYWENTTEPEKCIEGAETGNVEYEEGRHRKEFYHEDCTTYWGPWIYDEVCEQDKWTGNERRVAGWIQREYYNADCSTYWKNWKKERDGCTNGGCVDFLSILFLVLYTLIPIYLAIKYGSFWPILLGIGIPLLLASLGYILNFLGRYPRFSLRFGRWLMSLFALLIGLSLLNGLISLFETSNWSREEAWQPDTEASYDIEEVELKEEESSYIPDEIKPERSQLKVTLKWRDFNSQRYQGTYYLYKDEINDSRQNLNAMNSAGYTSYGSVYSGVYNNDKGFLRSVYHMLDSIKTARKPSQKEFANIITTMVQSIEYVLVLDTDCNDPWTLRNKEIREMLQAGIECDGNAPFGIRTPIEFLSTLKGDCDTRTLLLYTIFKHYNYDVAIINSEYYGHSMLGLSLQGARGVYKYAGGRKYYFWETTSEGFRLGKLPPEMGNLAFWKVELN